jgi:hypothetical protein
MKCSKIRIKKRGITMKQALGVAIIAITIVNLFLLAGRYGWFTILDTPEGVGNHPFAVAREFGAFTTVEYFHRGRADSRWAILRSCDVRIDSSIIGSRVNNGVLHVGEARDVRFPTKSALILGGLFLLILFWRSVRNARLAHLRLPNRQA